MIDPDQNAHNSKFQSYRQIKTHITPNFRVTGGHNSEFQSYTTPNFRVGTNPKFGEKKKGTDG